MKNERSYNVGLGRAVNANYVEQMIPDYQGNPLIEALPPILSEEEAVEALISYPQIEAAERYLSPQYRYHCVNRLQRYFQPMEHHLILERQVACLIRQGYIGRNPRSKEYTIRLQQNNSRDVYSEPYKNAPNVRSGASSFSLIGVSGIGKTTALERILSLYPQIIVHETPLNLYQLVWVKLDCPFDGSLKGLCINFFMEVDRLLGTNYYKKFASSRLSVDTMLAKMSHVANLHCVGALIIDEIQHLSLAKSGGADKMLNFFVTLINTIGIPVILVGTPKALSVLSHEFRQARRSSGYGNSEWKRMERDDNWDLLIEGMWHYQWTQEEILLTEELKEALYEESQGIIDIAIKIYMMAQWQAISTGKEYINAATIHQVAKENLQLVKPMLQALRTGNILEISNFDDIRPINLEEYHQRFQPSINIKEKIRQYKLKEAEQRQRKSESILEQVALALLQLQIDPSRAQIAAEKAIAVKKETESVSEVIQRAARLALDMSVTEKTVVMPKAKTKPRTEQRNTTEPILLVDIVNQGKKKYQSAYEALKESGWIKSAVDKLIV
ncbi:ATP-binding protein [Heliobacterium chlorum]|uniref:ATP-binding protein n=2 Tax=Heliobacterium chlorum TaxID=2698 RepID=A0ABR7T413_HELCL|nr:ATP-binding protein [Heliobacterium chlorum]